ncbi:MAG: four helix bundle protein [Planctomycetota bacterium]
MESGEELMMAVKDYRELIVWQKAVDLVEAVYRASASFPKEEVYGLTSQIRRAAVSVPSNIAEGQARNTTADFLHFLSIARGSLKEVETQVIIARRLGYIDAQKESELTNLTEEVSRLISGLTNSLKKKT